MCEEGFRTPAKALPFSLIDQIKDGEYKMVPPEGESSNVDIECDDGDQTADMCACDDMFSTLSEWSDYLENHVPYYQESRDDPTP